MYDGYYASGEDWPEEPPSQEHINPLKDSYGTVVWLVHQLAINHNRSDEETVEKLLGMECPVAVRRTFRDIEDAKEDG